MNMPSSSLQVKSINNFTCQHFQQFFEGNNHGVITTTSNGRTYHARWDRSTETISVMRDLTNVDSWTRISETVERWLQFDFTSNAAKWESRLTIQNCNVRLTEPLKEPINELLAQLNATETSFELGLLPRKVSRDQFTQISSPLIQLLDEKKQGLFRQAQQLSLAVNDEVAGDKLWTQQQNIRNDINSLKEQISQLEVFIRGIKNTIGCYCAAVAHIDVLNNSLIYDAVITRLSYVAIDMRKMLDTYFAAAGRVPQADIEHYNIMIRSEKEIAGAFKTQPLDTHFSYNELLSPPSYKNSSEGNAQRQGRIKLNYQNHIFVFTNFLLDKDKTFADIQNAACELRLVKNRWQEQIGLDEEISELLTECQNKEESLPVYLKRREQLQILKDNIFNNGTLLDIVNFELLKSEYKNVERANALCVEINQFVEELPGFVDELRSNYNDEMQSRVLYLKELSHICQNEPLTDQILDQLEEFIAVGKHAIQTWVNSEEFSRLKFYDPIPTELTYPRWLMKEHIQFKQKTQEILNMTWEAKQVLQHSAQLVATRGELVKICDKNTEVFKKKSEEYKKKAIKVRRSVIGWTIDDLIYPIQDLYCYVSDMLKTEDRKPRHSRIPALNKQSKPLAE